MILNKKNKFLEKHENFYSIATLIVNDNLKIDLDKPLNIESYFFVAGNVDSNVDIGCEAGILIQGSFRGSTLASKREIVVRGRLTTSSSIRSNGNIQIGYSEVLGSVVANGSILCYSTLKVKGSVSAENRIASFRNLEVDGDVACGMGLDVHESFVCFGRVKVAGIEVFSYGRLNSYDATFVVTGDVLTGSIAGEVFNPIINAREYVNGIISGESKDFSKLNSRLASFADILFLIDTPFSPMNGKK